MLILKQLTERLKELNQNPGNRKTLLNFSVFSSSNIISQFLMMIYAIVVARALGIQQLGIYSSLYALLGVSITLVNFGQDTWMLHAHPKYSSIEALAGHVIATKLIIGTLWMSVGLLILPTLNSGVFTFQLVAIASIDMLADSVFATILAAWNIQTNVKDITRSLLVSRAAKLILCTSIMLLGLASPISVAFSRMFVSLLVLIYAIISLKPKLHQESLVDWAYQTRLQLKTSSAFGYSEILATIYANADLAILSFFSITQAGLYSPASGIIHALFVIPNSFQSFILPRNVNLVNQKSPIEDLKSNLKRLLVIFFILGLMISAATIIFASFFLVPVLGRNFEQTSVLLKILSPIMLFKSISFGLAIFIISNGLQRKRLIPQLIGSILNITLNLLLIPRLGVQFVAWNYVACEALLTIGYGIIVKNFLDRKVIESA